MNLKFSLLRFETSAANVQNLASSLDIIELQTGEISEHIPSHMPLMLFNAGELDGYEYDDPKFIIAHNEAWIVARDNEGGILAFDVKKNCFSQLDTNEKSNNLLLINDNQVSIYRLFATVLKTFLYLIKNLIFYNTCQKKIVLRLITGVLNIQRRICWGLGPH